jgi:hypothetical protein
MADTICVECPGRLCAACAARHPTGDGHRLEKTANFAADVSKRLRTHIGFKAGLEKGPGRFVQLADAVAYAAALDDLFSTLVDAGAAARDAVQSLPDVLPEATFVAVSKAPLSALQSLEAAASAVGILPSALGEAALRSLGKIVVTHTEEADKRVALLEIVGLPTNSAGQVRSS